MPRNNYEIHYRNLQQCLEKGLLLKKVCKILKFKQKDWMKPYIDFNIVIHKIFDKYLVAIHEKETCLTLNKPIYVGVTVLEISKLATYSFHYDLLKKIFNDFKFLFTNTDSLCYEICNENSYEKFYEHREYFDLSNYSKNSKKFHNDNQKVLGKMKDEYAGNVIKEFIGLRSKMYSILDTKNNEKSTHKGHNSYIKYGEFCDTLFNKNVLRHKMRGIKSKNHNLITYESNKTSTSCFDDKRYILNDGIDALPYGHKDIAE